MSVFKQVYFDKIYSGNLAAENRNYCDWYSIFSSASSTTSSNTTAFGVYSLSGLQSCKAANAASTSNGLLNRYLNDNTATAPTLNFINIKRKSNFLVPVLLGTGNNKMINFSVGNSEDATSKLYTIHDPVSNSKLNGFNLNYETTRSFLADSFIITKINNDSIDTFSIFYNMRANPIIFNSENNSSINIVFSAYEDSEFKKTLSITSLQQFTFYKYKYDFQGTTINGITNLTLYTPENLSDFLTEVAKGNIYVTKESLLNDSSYLKNPIEHPLYVNTTLKLEYYNSNRTKIITTKTVHLSGQTDTGIDYDKFSGSPLTFKYIADTFAQIIAIDEDNLFLNVSSTADPLYYPGGILRGWTKSSTTGFTNGAPQLTYTGSVPYAVDTLITAAIIGNSFYNSSNVPYFYFSNKNDTDDDSTIDSSFGTNNIISIKLYPIYTNDPNYVPEVVEIRPRRGVAMSDQYITFTKKGLDELLLILKQYPVTNVALNTTATNYQFQVTKGDASTNSININIPDSDDKYNLGSTGTGNAQKRWKNLYLSGNANIGGNLTVTGNITGATGSFTSITVGTGTTNLYPVVSNISRRIFTSDTMITTPPAGASNGDLVLIKMPVV